MRYILEQVDRLPRPLLPGRLYWSKEFGMSGHLCACGCGDSIYLPVGPVDYSITAGPEGPTLRPSVGNWNVCDAHYLITAGEVVWAGKWSPEKIAAGRASEDARRATYYAPPALSGWQRVMRGVTDLWNWLLGRR